jgi:hypothetical protein
MVTEELGPTSSESLMAHVPPVTVIVPLPGDV